MKAPKKPWNGSRKTISEDFWKQTEKKGCRNYEKNHYDAGGCPVSGHGQPGFASPASDLLAQEEVTTGKMVNLMQGKGQLADVAAGFTPELQKNFNAAALANLQKGFDTQLVK